MPPAPTSSTIYEPVPGWAKIPHGFWLREATSVAVDAQDRVYVFNRGNMPMLVFDAGGNLVDHWGNATPHGGQHEIEDPYGARRLVWDGVEYGWPHSVRVDPEGALWLVDVHAHKLTKTDTSGRPLMSLGGTPAPAQSGDPFNKPTDLAINPSTGTSSSATATATPACIATRRRASTCCRGGSRAPTTASSACPTTSPWSMTST